MENKPYRNVAIIFELFYNYRCCISGASIKAPLDIPETIHVTHVVLCFQIAFENQLFNDLNTS